jgi:hypothetical protein
MPCFLNLQKLCQADSQNRPVTGIRLYLEGDRNDRLAVHLHHLTSLPCSFQISDEPTSSDDVTLDDRAFYEPIKWALFSHVCTAPVQYNGPGFDECAAIVTKAWLEVKEIGLRKVLFLRLGFSSVASMRIRRSEWDGHDCISRKSGFSAFSLSIFLFNINWISPVSFFKKKKLVPLVETQ